MRATDVAVSNVELIHGRTHGQGNFGVVMSGVVGAVNEV